MAMYKNFLGSIFYHLVTQTANKLVPPNLMHQATSKTGCLLKVGAGGGKRRNTNLFLFPVLIYILKTASLLPNAKLLLNSAQPLEILASHVPSQLSVPIPELRLKPTRDYTLSTLVKNKGFSNLVQACTSPTHHMKAEHIVYFFKIQTDCPNNIQEEKHISMKPATACLCNSISHSSTPNLFQTPLGPPMVYHDILDYTRRYSSSLNRELLQSSYRRVEVLFDSCA